MRIEKQGIVKLTSEKSIFMSKDKPCILKKRLNGVFDQNAGLIN